ncbi:MAG: hypothetical protein R2781_00940 [Flavobacteriaceae bacterium]
MSLKTLSFVTLLFSFSFIKAQHVREDYNLLGIQGGATLFDIKTSNFETQQGTGIFAGFVTHGDVYNDFDLEYGITFIQNKIGILGRESLGGLPSLETKYIPYTLSGVQVKFMASYNIIGHYLSLDFGPILNVNGKLKLNQEADKDFIIEGYQTLRAEDLSNVSRVHLHAAGGITAGFTHFRVNAQYQYGVTNVFNRYNDSEIFTAEKPEGGFKGNTSTILLGAYIFF